MLTVQDTLLTYGFTQLQAKLLHLLNLTGYLRCFHGSTSNVSESGKVFLRCKPTFLYHSRVH
jgi:hypothetical protein